MTEAQHILNMIENVDPSDEKMLDEIDRQVWLFINRGIVCDVKWNERIVSFIPCNHEQTFDVMVTPHDIPHFSTNRDLVKSIIHVIIKLREANEI